MEDLTQNWSQLTLSDREGPGCSLTRDDGHKDFSIAAKFLTKRALNVDVIARTFTPLWRCRNGFEIKSLGEHKILFTFDNKQDVDRILMSEPWSFDKHLVVMQRYEKDTPIHELQFDRASFWVQVNGIPLRYMTMEAAEKICAVIGDVSRPTDPRESDGGMFLRLKVSIDLSLPLCRGRLISLENGKQIWVSFKYERLPNLCYWCGRLTHDDKDCEIWLQSEGTLRPEERQFGSGLRAPAFVASRKHVITVPGFYAARKKPDNNGTTFPDGDISGHPTVTVGLTEVAGDRNGSFEEFNANMATHRSDCNVRTVFNSHNSSPEGTQGRNSGLNLEVNNVINKGSNCVISLGSNSMITQSSNCVTNENLMPKSGSVQQTVESDKHLLGIDAELSKFDIQNSPAIGPESRAFKIPPIQTQVNEAREENINSEILLLKSISSAELFDIQIREIDEALIKFGKRTDGEIKAKEASTAEITPQKQCDEAKEGRGACEVELVQARGQLKGSGRVHAQSVQRKINTANPKKTYTRGGRKYQACARVVKKDGAAKLVCGKRGGEDHLELPGKRRLVSKDDGSSFSMVEAVCQPRQSP